MAKRYPPYLLAQQIAALKSLSDDTETPVQYHIRQAIDEYLGRRQKRRVRSKTKRAKNPKLVSNLRDFEDSILPN